MSKKPVVIGYMQPLWSVLRYMRPWLRELFAPRVIRYIENPTEKSGRLDYLLYTAWGPRGINPPGTKRVLVCCEPMSLRKFHPHSAIHCTLAPHHRPTTGHFVYIPFAAFSMMARFSAKWTDLIRPPSTPLDDIIASKTRFCAFMYRVNHAFRNQLFSDINAYKKVDALGQCMNRARQPKMLNDRASWKSNETFMDRAVAKYKPYKFVIACENSEILGYITEKIISPFLARAIPIYLGAPDIKEYINPKSFIHVADYATRDLLCAAIQRLDTDPEAYREMLAQPIFVDNVAPDVYTKQGVLKQLKTVFR